MLAIRGTQKVPLTWQYVTLKNPLEVTDPGNVASKMTIPAGTVIRLYTGVVGYANDDKSNPIKTPNSKGFSLIETLPDSKSLFWNYYKDEPQYYGLLQSQDYAKLEPARLEHLWMVQFPKSDGKYKDTLVSQAMADYYDKLNSGVAIPKPDEASSKDEEKDGEGGSYILPALVIGALAGFALYQAAKGKR
jgi:hypothetical protein